MTEIHDSRQLLELLERVTVSSADDGEKFTDRTRIEAIKQCLSGSKYRLRHDGNLSLIYSKLPLEEMDEVLLLSSHIDCVPGKCFVEQKADGASLGTFDNSATNAMLIAAMLADRLPDNAVVAFTGDEEKDSTGAIETFNELSNVACRIGFAIVLDVTNEGYDKGCHFTIENDYGIDIVTGHAIVETVSQLTDNPHFLHFALPDESYVYDDCQVPVLTLCLPVKGDMHSDLGCLLRTDSLAGYIRALTAIAETVGNRMEK